jgi:hypothetical protein
MSDHGSVLDDAVGEWEDVPFSDGSPPPSSKGKGKRNERRRWRGGKPPDPPVLHAMFTDIYHQPQFYRKWVRRVEMWERRVRHYKPLGEAALDLAEVITGDAAPIIEDIDWHDLDRQDGVQRISTQGVRRADGLPRR